MGSSKAIAHSNFPGSHAGVKVTLAATRTAVYQVIGMRAATLNRVSSWQETWAFNRAPVARPTGNERSIRYGAQR
jgi:hypothetical protein